ncbi:MAG: 16S rRNA (cytosine(1402)-N(4))-methyltransferase RsmH [Anaerolineales bacterium]|nr:16S rRNA (cytosine(1402)-N(4))-methyltransferase RsmH [Anaerolineales bacterium]
MHRPVLYHEMIHALQPRSGGRYVDCTLGAGGHAWAVLQASQPDGCLLGLDVDPQALDLAQERLAEFGGRVILRRASYTTLAEQLAMLNWSEVDGVMFDLGVSSMQLDTPERGFSFRSEAPLDMRFDPHSAVDAGELVNHLPEKELADLLYRYGEEKRSRRVAHAILHARPITSTTQLAEVVAAATVGGRQGIHPATRTFQALRIAVNRELEALEEALPQAANALASGGRIAVIAFHSLEDRIVKNYFRQESRDCLCPPRQPQCTCGHRASLKEVTRQPIRPSPQEVLENPRSRSARLRVAERL